MIRTSTAARLRAVCTVVVLVAALSLVWACADRGQPRAAARDQAQTPNSFACADLSDSSLDKLAEAGMLMTNRRQTSDGVVQTHCVWGDEKVGKCFGEAAETECDLGSLISQRFNSVSIQDYASVEEARKPVNKAVGPIYTPMTEVPNVDEAFFGPGFLGESDNGKCDVKIFTGARHVTIGLSFSRKGPRLSAREVQDCQAAVTEIAIDFAERHLRK